MVIYSVQHAIETLGNFMQVIERQLTFVKLSIDEDIVDEFLDHPLNPVGSRVDESAGCRFDTIGQHDNTGFTSLRLGSGIAEILLFYRLTARTSL